MFLIPVICPRCENEIKIVERKKKFAEKIRNATLCKDCKEQSLSNMRIREKSVERRKENSERLSANNPMHKAESRAKMVSTQRGYATNINDYIIIKKDIPRETPEELSLRMKTNNPMFNPELSRKGQLTKKSRVLSGEITYKRGSEHHLWKGNRDMNNSCRRDLYPVWVFPILTRDQFTCTMCGNKKNLQVHHIKPLRNFIQDIKEKYNIKSFHKMDGDELLKYVNEIVSLHELKDGITVCSSCHSIIDSHYTHIDRK